MSMRPDFAQKLLNDLKMRKERMGSTKSSNNSSIISADAYGSSRRSLKSSTDMKSLTKATSNTGKLQRASSRSQSTRTNIEASNQIVPYGGGHSSKQPLDLSMTLSYALDDNGKLKKMDLTGSSAMIGFLRQISRRSMETGNSYSQWPSNAHFPTLTNLHIDEVSKGAQKLNQILKTFYNGVNSNGYSVDVGKELLKGTKELEESLRMLVSLQEASEQLVVPKRKSKLKLLEMSDDRDEGNGGKVDEKKRVEKPVFSFDKRVKNDKQVTSHRRSATCESSQFNSKAGGMGISNVVAKLMGLEESPSNGGESEKARNELTRCHKELDRVISQRMSFGVSRSSEYGDEDVWSNKIVILTSKESDERKSTWSEREREKVMTHIMQLNRKNSEDNMKEQVLERKETERRKSENLVQGKRVSKENGHEKSRVGRDKSLTNGRLQHPKSPQRVETQGKNQKLEPRSNKKGPNKAPLGRKTEASEMAIENPSLKDIHEVKSSPVSRISSSQAKDAKDEKVQREIVLLQEAKKPLKIDNSVSIKEESLVTFEEVKPQANENVVLIRKVAHNSKMAKSGPNQKANEVMAKLTKSASRPSRAMRQQATMLQGLKRKQPVNKGSQAKESHTLRSKNASSKTMYDNSEQQMEIQESTDSISQVHSNQEVNFELPCDQLDQQQKPQTSELIQVSDNRELRNHLHSEKEALMKLEIQQPLTEDEIYLKQILITSQVFLNTAEALFKLNIPLGILNASDITCQQEQDTKQMIDCAYEILKTKGKRQELVFYPCKNALISNLRLKSLDDLVRQIHKDFENLRKYGKTDNNEYDQAEYLLKMLERDIYHKDMDVNSMWDIGWNDTVFGYIEMDEVIRDVEKCMLNELLDDVLEGFMEISSPVIHGVIVC